MKKYLKEFAHNVVVHPLMMLLPPRLATSFDDKNADWAFGSGSRYDEIKLEKRHTAE